MINRVLEAVTAAILALAVGIAFVAVIFRYVLGSALSWSFEASLALLTYLTFIGGYLALRQGSHLKVDVFVNRLPLRWKAVVFIFNQLVIAGVGMVMVVWGGRQAWLYHAQTTMVMEIPLGFLYVAVPLSGLAIGLEGLWRLVAGLRRVGLGEDPEPANDGLAFGAGED